MATATLCAPQLPVGGGPEQRQDPAQPGPTISLPLNTLPEAVPYRSSCPPSSANARTHGYRHTPSPSFKVLLGQQLSGALNRLRISWKYSWNKIQAINYRQVVMTVIAFVALVVGGVAAFDGYKSRRLAEWTAGNEFRSSCEEHKWPSPSCDTARDKQPEAPPNFDGSEWKRHISRDWGAFHPRLVDENAIQANYDVSPNMLITLWVFPVCAFLLVGISLLRNSGVILPRRVRPHLRGLTKLPKRLFVALAGHTRPVLTSRSEPTWNDLVHFASAMRLHATTSGADVMQSQGSQLRRRNAAQFNDDVDGEHLSDLTEWNIPSILGEAKEVGFVGIHNTQDAAVPIPYLDLSSDEVVSSAQSSSASPIKHKYRSIQVTAPDKVRSNSPGISYFARSSFVPLFDKQAQASTGDLETLGLSRSKRLKSQQNLPDEKRVHQAWKPECVASLGTQDACFPQRHPFSFCLVLRPVNESAPSHPRGPSLQWSVHLRTRLALRRLLNNDSENIMPEFFERPLAVYIFNGIGNQLRSDSHPLSPALRIWSKSGQSNLDPSQQLFIFDCVRIASMHLLEHYQISNTLYRQFTALHVDTHDFLVQYILHRGSISGITSSIVNKFWTYFRFRLLGVVLRDSFNLGQMSTVEWLETLELPRIYFANSFRPSQTDTGRESKEIPSSRLCIYLYP